MIPTLRRATTDDLPAIVIADSRAFGTSWTSTDLDDFRPLFAPARFLLACQPDDGTIIGVAAELPFDVTLPGGGTLSVPGVSWVSVAVTHRRLGILRALLVEQHRGFVAAGAPVSLLTATEGGIYGRFGYGVATVRRSMEINRRRAVFRADVPDPGGVRLVEGDELRSLAPSIHRRWTAITPGALSRSDAWWDLLLADREHLRGGASAMYHLAHADGYASYRVDRADNAANVIEVVAATEASHAALWRVLLGLDLVDTVRVRYGALDDPLPDLLLDPRQVRTTDLRDGMWARVLDVPAALAARRYAVEVDVVLGVRDPFLDLGGWFRLRGGPDGAECAPVGTVGRDEPVEVEMAALGSLLFGGARATALARAGLLTAPDPGVLRRLDAAMLADRLPQHGTEF